MLKLNLLIFQSVKCYEWKNEHFKMKTIVYEWSLSLEGQN